jgi:hypothetical protein
MSLSIAINELSFLNLTINSQVNVLGVCYGSAILIFEQAPCQHQQGREGQEKNCLAPCQNWQAVLGKKRSAEVKGQEERRCCQAPCQNWQGGFGQEVLCLDICQHQEGEEGQEAWTP